MENVILDTVKYVRDLAVVKLSLALKILKEKQHIRPEWENTLACYMYQCLLHVLGSSTLHKNEAYHGIHLPERHSQACLERFTVPQT